MTKRQRGNRGCIPCEAWLAMKRNEDIQQIMLKTGENEKIATMIYEDRRQKEADKILEERRARRQKPENKFTELRLKQLFGEDA